MTVSPFSTSPSSVHSNPFGSSSSGDQTASRCIHAITNQDDDDTSVLSLACSKKYLFSGSQGSAIHVWSLDTFQLVTVLQGHHGSVLGLTLSTDQQWLFSSSGDGTVRVWSIDTLECDRVIHSCHDVGDIFSMVYTPNRVLFFGCQNTSIQWYDFKEAPQQQRLINNNNNKNENGCQKTQFFKLFHDLGLHSSKQFIQQDAAVAQCVIRTSNVYSNAHDGYVYSMTYAQDIPNLAGQVLLTGSGDGHVKIWSIQANNMLQHHQTLTGGDPDRGILSLAISDEGYLFCGVQGGHVEIWDLETYQLIKTVAAHADDVLSVIAHCNGFVSASADGSIKIWNEAFCLKEVVDQENGIILSMVQSNDYLITGSSNHSIKMWNVAASLNSDMSKTSGEPHLRGLMHASNPSDLLLRILEKWISIRTISGQPQYLEECRRGAKYLKNIMQQLGATSQLIPSIAGKNPLVYAKFSANQCNHRPQTSIQDQSTTHLQRTPHTVLFYGHYDVMPVENQKNEWLKDPFKLTGLNGYLYGRGTSDNKGPIVSSLLAVHELFKENTLDVNVIFLIEGEEECGSSGFLEALTNHHSLLQDIDLILLSNSYWLGEDIPCITYGLRGVVRADITVSSGLPNFHSGVEGGAISEPLIDLVHVVGKLVDCEIRVLIPDFYQDVLPITPSEERLYEPIVDWIQSSKALPLPKSRSQHSCVTSPSLNSDAFSDDDEAASNSSCMAADQSRDQIKNQLMSRWRYPTLTVHKVDVSVNNPTIISNSVTATISMRIVPNQEISDICNNLKIYVYQIFDQLKSDNQIKVDIQSSADYWLGDPDSEYFKAAERAIENEWHIKPLYIREGGSIPAVRWLEKVCKAPAIHIPFGQSSDQAHLPNERIRLHNLHAGKRIIKALLQDI
ncbi:60S ribosomal protein L17B [Mucor velutinosus]|uniref:60S ribosomal protein L17B n=1 Tax=Mucor velutinosus TaxID=708070 RepID=A0AAN7DDE0_9FUNG|nr:60S ribosomal protein L17B [Mucor velutinosus]